MILERLMQASYHSPLEGESQKPSRQAKADAVGGDAGLPAGSPLPGLFPGSFPVR